MTTGDAEYACAKEIETNVERGFLFIFNFSLSTILFDTPISSVSISAPSAFPCVQNGFRRVIVVVIFVTISIVAISTTFIVAVRTIFIFATINSF